MQIPYTALRNTKTLEGNFNSCDFTRLNNVQQNSSSFIQVQGVGELSWKALELYFVIGEVGENKQISELKRVESLVFLIVNQEVSTKWVI